MYFPSSFPTLCYLVSGFICRRCREIRGWGVGIIGDGSVGW